MNIAYNRRKGATFELNVMKWFRSLGITVERLRLSGKNDEGDIAVIVGAGTYLFECKNTATLKLDEFWRQVEVEAKNYAKARKVDVPFHYVLWKRKQKGINKTWVIQDLEQWLKERK